MKNELILLGRILKTSGEGGNVIIKIFEEIDFNNIDFLFVEIEGTYIPYKINEIKKIKKNSLEIKLKLIDNTRDAAEIISKNIFIENSNSKNSNDVEIIGYIIINEDLCQLGKVINIIKNNTQELLEIMKKTSTNSFLIPYVDEFIINIDHEKKTIYVRNMWKITK